MLSCVNHVESVVGTSGPRLLGQNWRFFPTATFNRLGYISMILKNLFVVAIRLIFDDFYMYVMDNGYTLLYIYFELVCRQRLDN